MKNKIIVILTDHYLPSNKASVNRVKSWAKYLPNHNYYPVIFTRNHLNSLYEYVVQESTHEIHYVKVHESLFLYYRMKFAGTCFEGLFGLMHKILENFLSFSSMRNLYISTKDYIKSHDVSGILATGPGYKTFIIASRLSDEEQLKWIADYRDDWSTTEIEKPSIKYLKYYYQSLEKMVLKNASAFISISPWYIKKINNLINVKGYLIENGYDLDNDENKGCKNLDPIIKMEQVLDCNKFNIIYPGTLYKTQSLQYFADMLSYLNPEILRKISFKIIGMKESDVLSKHIVLNKYHPWLVNIYERVDKSIADKYMIDAEAVLHIAHVDSDGNIIKGIPSSKLYDYIKYKKCVIMAPPDKDIAQEKLTTCGLGIVSESPMELSIKITKLVEDWLVNGSHPNPTVNIIEYQKNTRECRVEELAKILDIYFS